MAHKYSRFDRSIRAKPRPYRIHPLWQGIGCVMMFLIPIMSYAGSILLVQANMENGWFPATDTMMQTVFVPLLNISVDHLYANLLVTVALACVGFALLMLFYSVMYSAVGPSRFGPLDAPPVREAGKRSARRR